MHKMQTILPVEVRDLSYIAAGRQLIDGLDLDLDASGITAIMGPNGAGKSLLLRLLHGLITPSSGNIRWAGNKPGLLVRRRQAMVFQRPIMLRRSVAANVDFVLKIQQTADKSRRDEILTAVDLLTLSGQSARRLSGGEQQRLALARALVTEPAVLFLDEPTANLDPSSTAAIETIVNRARDDGTKIVLVTHDIGQARRLADDIVLMNRGKIVERSEAKRFFESPSSEEGIRFLRGELVI